MVLVVLPSVTALIVLIKKTMKKESKPWNLFLIETLMLLNLRSKKKDTTLKAATVRNQAA